ncbi:glycosyltransferase family 2 protein [Spirosoma fluminis]
MLPVSYHFDNVSLLITHYNRSHSLQRLLAALSQLACSFAAIVVSDDGSKPEHQEALVRLQNEYGFSLVTTPKNRGLGHNMNKGQDAVTTPYTLYVQEDFVPKSSFPKQLKKSLGFMDEDKTLDIVRFYAYYAYPYLKPFTAEYAEMHVPRWALNYTKIYVYSDHPHLRRSSFLTKFGRYAEGLHGDRTEYKMCISFIQRGGRGLFFTDFKSLFSQENDAVEPSTVQRTEWTQSNNPFIAAARYVYRQLRYNYDIQFMQ